MITVYRVVWSTALNDNIRDFDTLEAAQAFAAVRGSKAQIIEITK